MITVPLTVRGAPPFVGGAGGEGFPGFSGCVTSLLVYPVTGAPVHPRLAPMRASLTSMDEELRDLAAGEPALVDARTGLPLGVRLSRWLGAGGMSAVFLAEREPLVVAPLL